MKQLKHDNILPFYGVSTIVADFCLVFPWYENGNIMEYMKERPDTNRFDLASISDQTLRSHHLPEPTNSCWVQPGDCSFYTTIIWFTAP